MAFVNERGARQLQVKALPSGGVDAVDFRYTADAVPVNDFICMGRLPQGSEIVRIKVHSESLGPAGTQIDVLYGFEQDAGGFALGTTFISNLDVENAASGSWGETPFKLTGSTNEKRVLWMFVKVEGNAASGDISLVVEYIYHDTGY